MPGKQVTELDALPSFTDTSLLPVHNGAGLKKGLLSQLASYLGTKFSNPNLLINPDFRINQRGLSSYSAEASRIYTVDRWGGTKFTATVASNGITIQANKSGVAWFSQKLESATDAGFTVSVHVVSVTGTAKLRTTGVEETLKAGWNYFVSASSASEIALEITQGGSLTIDKIKLEQGSIATPFVAPNPAEELVKCERFLLFTPSSMVGYRFDSYIYVYLEKLKNMRTNGTCSVRGINNDTSLLANGEGQSGVTLGSGISVSKDKQFIRIDVKNISTSFKTKVLGIDMNKTDIIIDAEIY